MRFRAKRLFFSVCNVLGAVLKCLKALKVFVTTSGLEFKFFYLEQPDWYCLYKENIESVLQGGILQLGIWIQIISPFQGISLLQFAKL